MTYRLVPPKVWAQLQKVVLAVTAIIGLTIALAPPDKDARLTQLEKFMNVDIWAYGLITAAILAFVMEVLMERHKHERYINAVGYCHIVMCALMWGYAGSAAAGVLARTWWNFGAPAIGILIAYLHYIYVRRRPHAQH